MTPEMIDLGRRAVACKGWRRMPGMRVWNYDPYILAQYPGGAPGRVVLLEQRAGGELRVAWESGSYWKPTPSEWDNILPDFSDAATVGCLLALMREACGSRLCARPIVGGEWEVPHVFARGATEVEALVVALENAP